MELKKYKRIKNIKTLPKFDTGVNSIYNNPYSINTYSPFGFQLNNSPMTFNTPFTQQGGVTTQDIFGKSMLLMNPNEFFNQPYPKNKARQQYWKSVGKNALNNAVNIAMSGLDTANSISNAFQYNKSSEDMLNEAGTADSSINGIGYLQLNYANEEALTQELNATNKANTMKAMSSGASTGSTIGSIFGPVGGAVGGIVGGIGGLVGGLFGSAKRKREMRRRVLEANKNALLTTRENASAANSKAMLMLYEELYGLNNGSLYAYDKGKDKVVTPIGKISTKANSRVSVGEPVLDNLDNLNNTVGYVPKTGKPHADDNLANLSDSSVVLGSDKDWRTGRSFMDQGKPYTLALEKINKKYESRTNKFVNKLRGSIGNTTDELLLKNVNKLKEPIVELLNDLADQQLKQHEIQNQINTMRNYKCGKDRKPKYDIGKEGWLNNFIPNIIGAGLSLKQYNDAKGQTLHSPDIYSENPYEQRALNTLAGLRINAYPMLLQIRDAETRSNYAIDNSGGLTGALKYLGRIANANNMYSNISNMWTNLQEKNNAYKQQYASAALNAGNASASRRQAARQYKEDMYAKAHAARQQEMQMGVRNFMDYLNLYSANEFKRRQFNDMLVLYQQDMKDRKNVKVNNVPNISSAFTPISTYNPTSYAASIGSTLNTQPNFSPIHNIKIKKKGGLGDYLTWAVLNDFLNYGKMNVLL